VISEKYTKRNGERRASDKERGRERQAERERTYYIRLRKKGFRMKLKETWSGYAVYFYEKKNGGMTHWAALNSSTV
jgi:hypothetical protein